MRRTILTILSCLLFAITTFAQSGKFESNAVFKHVWDEQKDEYVSASDQNGTDLVMYYDAKKEKVMILVSQGKIIGFEQIVSEGSADGRTFYDGNKGTRIMYAKEENIFVVFYDQDNTGRYLVMFVFTGTHQKMSGKKIKKETNKMEFMNLQVKENSVKKI
jgi:hypothetical protein